MWDERYSIDDYLFGTEPAAFLVAHAHLLQPGSRALVVADGEGRNSVFLAQQGVNLVNEFKQLFAVDRRVGRRITDVIDVPAIIHL